MNRKTKTGIVGTVQFPASLIQLRPRRETYQVSQGRVVLVTGADGFVSAENPHQGLWVYQTRMLSQYRWLIGKKAPRLSACSNIEQHSWMGYYIQAPSDCKQTATEECDPLQETVELRLSRSIGGGMHEEVEITNHTQIETALDLELEMGCDFGDPGASKRGERGHLARQWNRAEDKTWQLEFDYEAEHRYDHQGDRGLARIHRGIRIRLEHSDSEPTYTGQSVSFAVKLAPHGKWHACIDCIPQVDGHSLPLQYRCSNLKEKNSAWDRARDGFLRGSTRFAFPEEKTLTPLVLDVVERSQGDLAALRLYDLDRGRDWIMAAGIPTYLALFGRDSLITAWQSSILGTEISQGALTTLPRYQATEINNWRDAEPGRMVHEVHTNPTAELNYSPHGLYYGGVTSSLFYPMVAANLWHWTGDENALRPFIEPSLKAIAWADKVSLDVDGFYKYRTRSEQGETNQGWKDSGDAIVHADGSQAEDPIGTCEMQAFMYASKLHFSAMLWWLGREKLSARLYDESQRLKKKFNRTFWMEEEGYLAMGIDSKRRLIRSIASDPGQCLTHGIVDESFAARLIPRMMAKDMFSGWGVRTLSASHPAYNPFAYHRGTVWPVMNAMFTLGFARYGFHREMHALAKAIFESASLFEHNRLPEVFAGHPRDAEHAFPGMYIKTDWPQAWSASAPFQILQSMLGLVPFAPLEMLLLNPVLPDWLPVLRVSRLRIGKAVVTLEFRRGNDGQTDYHVVEQEGALHVLRHGDPWSLISGSGRSAKDAMTALLAQEKNSGKK